MREDGQIECDFVSSENAIDWKKFRLRCKKLILFKLLQKYFFFIHLGTTSKNASFPNYSHIHFQDQFLEVLGTQLIDFFYIWVW